MTQDGVNASKVKLPLCLDQALPITGWINVDSAELPEVDLVVDLEGGSLPFETDSIAEFAGSHLLEHIKNSLGLMQELHRAVQERRNVVMEMVTTLRAIKPIRPPLRALQQMPRVRFVTNSPW